MKYLEYTKKYLSVVSYLLWIVQSIYYIPNLSIERQLVFFLPSIFFLFFLNQVKCVNTTIYYSCIYFAIGMWF